jgi:hypothetical protein
VSIPNNTTAEEDLLGAMLLNADALKVGLDLAEAEDFYDHGNSSVFAAIRELHANGHATDLSTVVDRLQRTGGDAGELRVKLVGLTVNVPVVTHAADYARVIARHAASRRMIGICSETMNALLEQADPYEMADGLTDAVGAIDMPIDKSRQEALTMPELRATAETAAPWVIPNLLRQDWRALVVAGEGAGKSTLLRQLAMLAAQGIHPFRLTPMEPVRTLIVDLENPVASITETGGQIEDRMITDLGDRYDPSWCRTWRRQGGIDPRTRHDRAELEREILLHRPQLVCIGPAYKMLHRRAQKGGTESHEEATEPVLEILDDLRTRYKFAVVIEHHAPQGYAGQRDMRPYGSQRWLAWPEIGISIKRLKDVDNTWEIDRHRGDRMVTDWPVTLHRRGLYPWTATYEKADTILPIPPSYVDRDHDQKEPF